LGQFIFLALFTVADGALHTVLRLELNAFRAVVLVHNAQIIRFRGDDG
jgi:hypothetical protein